MKKWIWQSKTSLSISSSPFIPGKLSLPWCIAGSAVILLAFVSCRFHHEDPNPNNLTVEGKSSPVASFAASLFGGDDQKYIRIVGSEDGGDGLIAELDTNSCNNPSIKTQPPGAAALPEAWKFRVKIDSPFGSEAFLYSFESSPPFNVKATVDGRGVEFIHGWLADYAKPESANRKWLADVCELANQSDDARVMKGNRKLVAAIAEWIAAVAPDCDIKEVNANGWKCNISAIEPELASREIERLKRIMFTSWSRQPYVIARRAAVSMTLAKSLTTGTRLQQNAALDRFCKVVDHSQTTELTLVMNSQRWRTIVCDPKNSNRFEVASIGLTKSLNELELLRRLFESTSKLGVLTVRIPRTDVPSANLMVSLKPDEDVAANLAKETSIIWIQRGSSGAQPPSACWHPIFSESPEMLHLAKQLDLAGDAPKSKCEKSAAAKSIAENDAAVAKYLANSVTSDTEFLLVNGQAKMLRLPTGSYSYTIHATPDHVAEFSSNDLAVAEPKSRDEGDDVDDGDENDESSSLAPQESEEHAVLQGPSTTGKIQWDSRRPRPLIRTW